ncbi:acyl-[acyl-carrier-protein] thioesterase [Aliifodinibius salipaludis]|uniref:acyl-[acyl-carrier-protein] thioesterase n=1 Tax=Fodinibius salipaludis TaxID=2032627 RepID=UPI00159563B9|nr:acyl-ACP thioesterase domain-containing protein [Aliifodinibius salipaludis]
MSNITFQETFKIRASEINFNQRATLPAICNLLQEVAGNHARELEFDITDLQKDELTWVLHRLHVKMDRFPEWRETITIKTWPSSGDGLRAYRDFLIKGENNNVIGRSLSYWLIMNIQSRRPARIPKKILEMAPDNTDHVLPVNDPNYSELDHPDYSQQFKVRKTDLDLNRHVNNVHFIEWALSCLPEVSSVNEIDIRFMAESVAGDVDIAEAKKHSSDSSNQYYHQIRRASDNKILAKAISN